jgi:hypothetical protein
VQVAHLGAVGSRPVEAQAFGLRVAQRQLEPVAKRDQRLAVQLLLLVRGHLALARLAHAVALLGLGQDDGRAATLLHRRRVGREDLHQVVTPTLQAIDLLVGQALRQCGEFRVLAEEVLAVEADRLLRQRSGTVRRPSARRP